MGRPPQSLDIWTTHGIGIEFYLRCGVTTERVYSAISAWSRRLRIDETQGLHMH
jgi:hypothetical protein